MAADGPHTPYVNEDVTGNAERFDGFDDEDLDAWLCEPLDSPGFDEQVAPERGFPSRGERGSDDDFQGDVDFKPCVGDLLESELVAEISTCRESPSPQLVSAIARSSADEACGIKQQQHKWGRLSPNEHAEKGSRAGKKSRFKTAERGSSAVREQNFEARVKGELVLGGEEGEGKGDSLVAAIGNQVHQGKAKLTSSSRGPQIDENTKGKPKRLNKPRLKDFIEHRVFEEGDRLYLRARKDDRDVPCTIREQAQDSDRPLLVSLDEVPLLRPQLPMLQKRQQEEPRGMAFTLLPSPSSPSHLQVSVSFFKLLALWYQEDFHEQFRFRSDQHAYDDKDLVVVRMHGLVLPTPVPLPALRNLFACATAWDFLSGACMCCKKVGGRGSKAAGNCSRTAGSAAPFDVGKFMESVRALEVRKELCVPREQRQSPGPRNGKQAEQQQGEARQEEKPGRGEKLRGMPMQQVANLLGSWDSSKRPAADIEQMVRSLTLHEDTREAMKRKFEAMARTLAGASSFDDVKKPLLKLAVLACEDFKFVGMYAANALLYVCERKPGIKDALRRNSSVRLVMHNIKRNSFQRREKVNIKAREALVRTLVGAFR